MVACKCYGREKVDEGEGHNRDVWHSGESFNVKRGITATAMTPVACHIDSKLQRRHLKEKEKLKREKFQLKKFIC